MDAVDRRVKLRVGNQVARAYGFRPHHDYDDESEGSEGQGDDAGRQPSASALPHPEDDA